MFRLLTTLLFPPRVTIAKKEVYTDKEFVAVGKNIQEAVQKLYGGRALRIRAVDAGSSNAEEIELTALNNAYYDIERFGLSFVASPRHADMLMVTGPITRNLKTALKTTYEATPKPVIVVAVGDGAIDGGIWKGSYAVVGGTRDVVPVDIEIPGSPPTPLAILRGVHAALTSARKS